MLGLHYIKFIYILNILNKINKKILCFILEKKLFIIKGVNQQETLLYNVVGFPHNYSFNKGSSETTCDITYNFNEYSNLMPEHKKKINNKFLE
jgi:hypothetical protein